MRLVYARKTRNKSRAGEGGAVTDQDIIAAQAKLIDQQAATIDALREALRLASRGPMVIPSTVRPDSVPPQWWQTPIISGVPS